MLKQLEKACRYCTTIFELASLTDEDLELLGLARNEIVLVAYKATLVHHD
jgi:uncharacterized protein YjiS (DUF1127 family)